MKNFINGFSSVVYSFSLWKKFVVQNRRNRFGFYRRNYWGMFRFWHSLDYVCDKNDWESIDLVMMYGFRTLNNEASLYRYRLPI